MDVLIDNFSLVIEGFKKTLWLLFFGGIIAMVLGTVMAALRVAPIALMRAVGTSYVNVVRNTPLLLILFIFLYAMPDLGVSPEFGSYFNFFFVSATLGLGIYTGAFVCEALRSGINSIPLGQAEAARSIGMTFTGSMRHVILPQAFRAVIPPLANTYIALAKNTSVAIAVGVTEASFQMRKLTNDYASARWWIFFGFAAGYILIVWAIAAVAAVFERTKASAR
jgi:glutamate transport system permease protein